MDRKLAVVDIGANSIHLLIARADPRGGLEVLHDEKEVVRLGAGLEPGGRLEDAAAGRAVQVLARFGETAALHGAEVHAVATSAVRDASDRGSFLERARREAGIAVEPIASGEEARLAYLGALHDLPLAGRRVLLIDIGGGSTELVIGFDGEVLATASMGIGALRVTERFFPGGTVRPPAVRAARELLREAVRALLTQLSLRGHDVAAGASGTIRSLARIVRAARSRLPYAPRHPRGLSRFELGLVIEELLAARTNEERLRIEALEPSRADTIAGGALILEQVLDELGIDHLLVSRAGLREGVIHDRLARALARS